MRKFCVFLDLFGFSPIASASSAFPFNPTTSLLTTNRNYLQKNFVALKPNNFNQNSLFFRSNPQNLAIFLALATQQQWKQQQFSINEFLANKKTELSGKFPKFIKQNNVIFFN